MIYYQILLILVLVLDISSLSSGHDSSSSGNYYQDTDSEDPISSLQSNCTPVNHSDGYKNSMFTEGYSQIIMTYYEAKVLAFCMYGCYQHYHNTTNIAIVQIPVSCVKGCHSRFEADKDSGINEDSSGLYQQLLELNIPPAQSVCLDYCEQNWENESCRMDGVIKNSTTQSPCLIGCEDIYYSRVLFAVDSFPILELPLIEFTTSQTIPEILIDYRIQHDGIIIIEVYDTGTFQSFYMIKELIASGTTALVEMDIFSCKEILLTYAFISNNRISRFSQQTHHYITGVQPLEPIMLLMPDDHESFIYDNRPTFFGHYVMSLSWTYLSSSNNLRAVQSFIIILRGIEIKQDECPPGNFTVQPHSMELTESYINETLITYNITAKEPSGPPIADCIYTIQILIIPKYSGQIPQLLTDINYITVPHYTPPRADLECIRQLSITDPRFFDMTIEISLDAYVYKERIVEYIEVIPKLITYSEDFHEILDDDSYALVKKPVQYTKVFNDSLDSRSSTVLKYLLDGNHYLPKSSPTILYQMNVYLYWNTTLLYSPAVQAYTCNISAQSPQPETIVIITPRNVTAHRLDNSPYVTIEQTITWTAPVINGVFTKYQLCLVDGQLYSTEDPSYIHLCHEVLKVNETSLVSKQWLILTNNGQDCLFLQIRVFNQYVSSNWSQPVIVSVNNQCYHHHSSIHYPTNQSQTTNNTPVTINQEQTPIIMRQSLSTALSSSVTASSLFTLVDRVIASHTPSLPSTSYVAHVSGSIAAGIVCLMLSIVIIIAIITLHWLLRRRKRRLESIQEMATDIVFEMGPRMQQFSQFNVAYDQWEIPPSQIIMDSVIGQGAFGEVYKGLMLADEPTSVRCKNIDIAHQGIVAIKLLKSTATGIEKCDFLKEIEIMKVISAGNSPHVVNMIGCVTSQEPICLITEFIEHGDLLTYLRINRRKVVDTGIPNQNPYSDLNDLNATDLVSFGYQIAAGMEFLSGIGIIHRDLACRNVLIGEGKTLKITDFGMSRRIGEGEDDAYIKTTQGKLPLKWMAIESIVDRQFTVYSDVWSYGITLWEIATLGGFPYPTIENDKLLYKLRNGYRMECPANCSITIYNIMLKCWSENPKSRPKFSSLRKQFDQLLSAQHADCYIDLQTNETDMIYTDKTTMTTNNTDCSISSTVLPSPAKKRCTSPGTVSSGSKHSISTAAGRLDNNWLQVTNPWILRSASAQDIDDSTTDHHHLHRTSSNCSSPLNQTTESIEQVLATGRPRSVQPISNAPTENLYVDEPATVITVTVSTPATPNKSFKQ